MGPRWCAGQSATELFPQLLSDWLSHTSLVHLQDGSVLGEGVLQSASSDNGQKWQLCAPWGPVGPMGPAGANERPLQWTEAFKCGFIGPGASTTHSAVHWRGLRGLRPVRAVPRPEAREPGHRGAPAHRQRNPGRDRTC
ncbi:hypothetical protein SKAU_G00283860 [Synaphobranchus kaupii]|uniref:Uncharacterized protein n=1 Tax=Synaphobranchus kaupii TaxID=118154 RepID=A0A9Q1EXN5_SYNKA|nr:hypothetical protein SKAU_G00283860 [Synaphobranchus kaupii]